MKPELLSRSRLGSSGFIAARGAEAEAARASPEIDPDLIEEIRSLVEREGIGEVMVSAGSDSAIGPAR